MVIFRRYRRGKNGELLDAWDYGLQAWPIKLKSKTFAGKR